jgi:hypothetical protein
VCAGEAEEEGYEDEYQLESVEVSPADYIKPAFTPNFRAAWEALPEDSEMMDDYGIGQRDSLQVCCVWSVCWCMGYSAQPCCLVVKTAGRDEWTPAALVCCCLGGSLSCALPPCPALPACLQDAVEAVGRILGMQACEGTDAVPPNARSHTLLLSGTVVGDVQVLVRLSFGIDAQRNVAMKLAVRSESSDVSEAIHAIIQEA